MSDLDSFEIRNDDSPELSPGPSRPIWPIVVAVIAILALIAGYFYYRSSGEQEATPEVAASAPAPAPAEPVTEEEPFVLPPLAESDDAVRQLVAALSANPDLAAALVPENLVRRFTATVVNLAEGGSPRVHVSHLAPEQKFRTAEDGQGTYIDPRGYQRYDALAEIFDSIDTVGAAKLYRNLKPLIQESYRELGYPDGDFDQVLAKAIGHMLDVPAVRGNVYLTPTVKGFDLADPALQNLSGAQKHLLRTGPENTRTIQGKLAAIVAELGL